MFFDDEGVAFNPFSIGPPTSNTRYSYEQPKSTTHPRPVFATKPTGSSLSPMRGYDIPEARSFPPPVYATWPPPKQPNNRSVSQGSLVPKAADDKGSIKAHRGEIALSKAINEEMAAAKQLNADVERILAGGKSKSSVPESDFGEKTVTTLMAVRKHRSRSKSSDTTVSTLRTPSKTVSRQSAHSQLSANKSQGGKAANEMMDTRSSAGERTESNITLKRQKELPNLTTRKESNASDNASRKSKREDVGALETGKSSRVSMASQADRVSIRSKASAHQADTISHASFKSKASAHQADNVSHASIKSKPSAHQSDNVSHASFKSKASAHQADNVSHASFKSKASVHQADNVSHASFKSKASARHSDNISHVSIKSKASVNRADNISHVSINSKASYQRQDNISRNSIQSKASAQRADNISHVSVKSKAGVHQDDNISRVSSQSSQVEGSQAGDMLLSAYGKSMSSPKELAEMVKKELEQSMVTTKSLAEKAALISDRLKAGNEFKHNRFHSVMRMYTRTEPLKRCREDRMSLWFKDAVLS